MEWSTKLVERISANPLAQFPSEEEGFQRLFGSKYVAFVDDLPMEYAISGNCSVGVVRLQQWPSYAHLPYRKNFPFATIIDKQSVN